MDARYTYSKLVRIRFTLTVGDVFDMLKKAGKVPDGMMLDCDKPEETDWPITLNLVCETKSPDSAEVK